MIEDKNKYSAEKFTLHFKESKFNQFGRDEEKHIVTEPIVIDGEGFKKSHFYFLNVIFEGNVILKGINLGQGFIFEFCEFKGELKFENCTSFEEQLGSFYSRKASLGITRCKVAGNISVKDCKLRNGFLFHGFVEEPSTARSLTIEGGEISESLSIENSSFEESVGIFRTEILGYGLRFENTKVGGTLRLTPTKCKKISFIGKSSLFKDNVFIIGQNLDSIVFNNGEFQGEITIENTSIAEYLSIFGTTFQDSFKVLASESPSFPAFKNLEVNIQDSQFNNGFIFTGENSAIQKLQINFSEKSSGVIDFRNTFFKEVLFKGINFNNSVFLRDCSYDRLTFSHFFNKAIISLNNNNYPDEGKGNPEQLLIENSNLGNTEFYDFDFRIYPSVRIIDSRLDSIFTYGTTWFENRQLNVEESQASRLKILSQRREIFRQLELAAEKQSDRITALDFKAREVEIHAQLIQERENDPNRGFQNWLIRKGDIAAIWLGKTNRHGQSWLLPFGLLILATILIYSLLVIAADPIISWKWDWSTEGWSLFKQKMSEHFTVFWQLFNPTRRFKDLFDFGKIPIPASAYFLDGLQRIILAFFIFQIVSAFRKFVK